MEISTSFEFLVIVLSIFLAIFLLLGIIFLYKAIEIANQLKAIAQKAENIVEKAEEIGEIIKKTAAPVAVGKFFANLIDLARKKRGRKGE